MVCSVKLADVKLIAAETRVTESTRDPHQWKERKL